MVRNCSGRPERGRAPTAALAGAPWARRLAVLGIGSSLAAAPIAARSETYYVDNANPACSGSALGTPSQPYCTITDAIDQHAGPGITIVVRAGSYLESVDVSTSGTATAPFVIQAEGPGVIMDGTDDFSESLSWTPYSRSVFLAESAPEYPSQVFVDGARLEDLTDTPPDQIPPGSYAYVEGEGLYVNLGGDNPGAHDTRVGDRGYAFELKRVSHVTIRGFHVTRFEQRGIVVEHAADDSVIANRVELCYANGVRVNDCSRIVVAGNTVLDNSDSGIALVYGTTGCTVQDNECGRNIVPDSFHDGSGIYLYEACGNLVQRNRLYGNNDEGLNIASDSNNNLSIQNIAWDNADHGFDQLFATGNVHIGDVSWHNDYDGFAVDGDATGTVLYDCIAVDNGRATGRFDLWVDESSESGFVSDYNIFWNSTPRAVVKYDVDKYTSVAEYSADSGQDAHTLQADPRFVDPAAGDFNLLQDSPAIDSGISCVPHWPPCDALGHRRVDDPSRDNTGAGSPPYADRGALEFQTDEPPVVTAPPQATASAGSPLTLNVGASDPDGDAILSLTTAGLPPGASFTVGAGDTIGTLSWTPDSTQTGTHTLTFTAANALSGSATLTITVNPASVLAVGDGIPPGMAPLVPRFSPSPVRAHGEMVFFTTRAGALEVALYDLSGRRVRELMSDANAPAGFHRLSVSTNDGGVALASGIYFVRVRAAEGIGRGRFAVTR